MSPNRHTYYSVLFLSAALFNLCMAILFIFYYPELLKFRGHSDITQNSLTNLFIQLFGLAVLLFSFIYAWIGLNPGHLYSFPLGAIACLGKSGVFIVMSGSAVLGLVPWETGPAFSIIDGVYAIFFAEYLFYSRRIIWHSNQNSNSMIIAMQK